MKNVPKKLIPIIESARQYINTMWESPSGRSIAIEALSSCAIENNEVARDGIETIRRFESGQTVGPSYLIRLAQCLGWRYETTKNNVDKKTTNTNNK